MVDFQGSRVELLLVSTWSERPFHPQHVTYLPLLQTCRPVAYLRRRSARHLGFVVLHILLREGCAYFLV